MRAAIVPLGLLAAGSLTLGGLALAGSGDAAAQTAPISKVVQKGRTLKIAYFYDINPDCTVVGLPTVNLTAAPESGSVETGTSLEFPTFPSTNARFACDKRRLSSTAVYYRAAPDFVGTVSLTLETVYASGSVSNYTYQVEVR